MEEQLKQYLSEFVEMLKQGGNAVMEELPLFIHEYLAWGFWEAVFLASFFFLLFIIGIFSFRKIKNSRDYFYDGENYSIALAFTGLFTAVSLIPTIVNLHAAIKITVAPRVYLLENLMRLLE